MPDDRPHGTVTFLFTDIEGSTRLWEGSSERMRCDLANHDKILRDSISRHHGFVFATGGDGFAVAFGRVTDAVACAIEAQRTLREAALPPVRMALHTGEAEERSEDYFGSAVNRAARLMGIANGGQVLLSRATDELLGPEVQVLDLGEHRLRDLAEAERVFQLCHESLPSAFPALRSLDSYPTNLPPQSTGFVGRHDEMIETEKALEESRVVTLTGVGGVGKTRLALQVAAEILPGYPDGAWLVDLGGAADAGAIEEAFATALGIAQQSGQSVRDSVLSFLSNKRLLLVLDNCEHVLDQAARHVGDMLRCARQISILATSREALRVDGEYLIAVPSLEVPEEAAALDLLAGAESVRLFVERARAARTGFALNAENAGAVVQLCKRLDGIPLAIELAAARVRSMAPGEIAARLDQRFRLLTGGSRTAANRHQTLRRAIDWSYDLLAEDERALLGRLSVCPGGFDLSAAEEIGSGDTVDAFEVDDLLCRLVEKSLVGTTDMGDATRYRMLETVREYALERLEATGEMPTVRTRHARHYAAFAGDAGSGLKGPEERSWLLRTEEELDNLRAAVTWSLESGDGKAALDIVLALGLQGLRIEPAVSSWAAMAASSPEAARQRDFPVALAVLGWSRLNEGRSDEAARLLDEALASLDRAAAHPSVVCRVLSPVSGAATMVGRDAEPQAQRWLEAARTVDDAYETACALNIIASCRAMTGNYASATTSAEHALAEAHRSGSPTVIAYCGITFSVFLAGIDPVRAMELLDESLGCAAAAENTYATSFAIGMQSSIATKQGDHPAAARTRLSAAELAHRGGHLDHEAMHIFALGGLMAVMAEPEPAAVLSGWAQKIVTFDESAARFATNQDVVDALAGLPDQLGSERYSSLTARGAAMSEHEVLAFAGECLAGAGILRTGMTSGE